MGTRVFLATNRAIVVRLSLLRRLAASRELVDTSHQALAALELR